MKGDSTRSTFRLEKHYSSVRMQQGRVQLDADWNEQIDIAAHRTGTETIDIIGHCGAPMHDAGFALTDGPTPEITKGRYYVDGILCENEQAIDLDKQPDLPDFTLPSAQGPYLAYLDVWERHITALEAPDIREVALGGPDTTTRTKVVWQVRLMPAETLEGAPLHCASELPLWDEVTAPSSGQLSARAEPGETKTDPCVVPARAGYRRLENQLYRVEVHRVISPNEITIKWSRENGSVVFGWTGQDNLNPNKLTLSSTGRDDVLGLATDDWVELTDDKHELRGEPGPLVKAVNVEGNVLTVDPGSETVDIDEFPVNPKGRRWDMPRDVGEISVDLTLVDNWIALENGVEVKLEPGTYRTGDYWLIPARTATRDIEWPRDDANAPLPQPPHGIEHHYCRLALLNFDGGSWQLLSDCRNLFPPLTEMIRFFHVAGDGQEALPGKPVPRPLEVGVVNGERPVTGARVRFQVVHGNGRLRLAVGSPCLDFTAGGANEVEVETGPDGPDGVAACCWRLDAATLSQQVEATLLEIDGKPLEDGAGTPLLTPIRFNANLSRASEVANISKCPVIKGAQTVQDALDALCGNSALYYVGGDGQEALPGEFLPHPLEVRVINGRTPVAGAPVRFKIIIPADDGSGMLKTNSTQEPHMLDTVTNEHGVASCRWKPDDQTDDQQVAVWLLGSGPNPVEPALHFNAKLSIASKVANKSKCPVIAKMPTVQKALDALCENSGEEEGIHVSRVDLISTSRPLLNDSVISFEQLKRGIKVHLDRAIETESVKRPTCYVMVEDPLFVRSFMKVVSAYVPVVLAAQLPVARRLISWMPTGEAKLLIDRWQEAQLTGHLLVRLILKGNYVWNGANGDSRIYLDGDTFGRLADDGSTGPDGQPAIRLLLPSGNGRRGGDFEMWFWVSTSNGLIIWDPPDFDWGVVPRGRAHPLSRRLISNSSEELRIDLEVASRRESFIVLQPNIHLSPGGEAGVEIRFASDVTGPHEGLLKITATNPRGHQEVDRRSLKAEVGS